MKARATAGARAAPARATRRARATAGAWATRGATQATATAGARTAVTRRATAAARWLRRYGKNDRWGQSDSMQMSPEGAIDKTMR